MKRNKCGFLLCTLLLLVGLSLSGRDAKAQEKTELGNYLSICYTTYDDGSGPESGMTTTVYVYDIDKKEIADFYSFPYDTQYPLGIYDKETDRLYFTQSADGGDQVFYYDIATQETVQLTDSLFAVNYIFPYGDRVFIVAAPKSSRSIILGCIDTDRPANKSQASKGRK